MSNAPDDFDNAAAASGLRATCVCTSNYPYYSANNLIVQLHYRRLRRWEYQFQSSAAAFVHQDSRLSPEEFQTQSSQSPTATAMSEDASGVLHQSSALRFGAAADPSTRAPLGTPDGGSFQNTGDTLRARRSVLDVIRQEYAHNTVE